MPSLQSLLLKIPDEFKPLAALGIGAIILVVLVLFHGLGLHRILVNFKRAELRLRSGRPHLGQAGFLFGWAVFLMLSLHIAEIAAWAYALIILGLIVRAADALYFCANAYTTLGYGTVDLGPQWRNISPIIAISGLFTFAWTTSSLVSIVTAHLKLVEQLELERAEQSDLRADARQAERDVLRKEKQTEKAGRLQTRAREHSLPATERKKIRTEEKEEEKRLHESATAEVEKIRREEAQKEDRLGETTPDGEPEVRK